VPSQDQAGRKGHIRSGDVRSWSSLEFERFFYAQVPSVERYVRWICPANIEVEEVISETFVVAWRRQDDIPSSHAQAWLRGVSRNVVRNLARSARRRERVLTSLKQESTRPACDVGESETSASACESLFHRLASLSARDQ